MNEITVYCDGSCNNRTNDKGGYGIVLLYNGHEKHISGGSYKNSTSARMEIRAVLEALRLITNKSIPITIYCDNQYTVKSISEGWALKWESELWFTGKGEDNLAKRINHDLWKQVLVELRKFPEGNVKLVWVKGHIKGEKYNNLADQLASIGGRSETIIDDKVGS